MAVTIWKLLCAINCLFRIINGQLNQGLRRSATAERGAALVFFLPVLAVLLGFLFLFSIRWTERLDSRNLRLHCREELTTGFKKVGDNIESLIALNRQVRLVRMEERAAKIALAFSVVFPEAAPAARALGKAAEAHKKLVKFRQKQLLITSQFELTSLPLKAWKRIRETSEPRTLVQRSISFRLPRIPRLGVRPKDKQDEIPEYELVDQFEQKQTMALNWQSNYSPRTNQEAKWTIARIQLPESCGMTLKILESHDDTVKLAPAPTQDKYFWKH